MSFTDLGALSYLLINRLKSSPSLLGLSARDKLSLVSDASHCIGGLVRNIGLPLKILKGGGA